MGSAYFPRQIESGKNALEKLGDVLASLGIRKALLVMDPFLAQTPSATLDTVKITLQRTGTVFWIYSEFYGEPTTEHVQGALTLCRENEVDGVVAIGGGSAMDIAKAVATLAVHPDLRLSDIPSMQRVQRLPLIAVPTTAGTGSEVTKVMVVTNTKTGVKMNPGHPDLVPDVAILDPTLTLSMPASVTTFTGVDALIHAMEAYVSRMAQPITDSFALTAIQKISRNLYSVIETPDDVSARSDMQLASMFAGLAFSNASTNLAHALGRPLGVRFHVPHGLSVAVAMPSVIRFGWDFARDRYEEIGRALFVKETNMRKPGGMSCVEKVEFMWEDWGIWEQARRLIDTSVLIHEIPQLSMDAVEGNGILSNIRIPTRDDIAKLYEEIAERIGL